MEKIVFCPLCNKKSFYKFSILKFTNPFNIYKCKGCQILFQYPFLEEKKIENFYREDYYKGKTEYFYEDERNSIPYYNKVWEKRVDKIKFFISYKKNDKERPFLDVGCSFGGLLKVAQNKGFYPYGVDISDYARKYCTEKLNISSIYKTVKEINKENFFSAITLIEVIEHLNNPLEMLQSCYTLLEKGGILVLQTANFNSLQAIIKGKNYNYFLPGHLFYFSRKNLKQFLKQVGFSKIKIFAPVEFGLLPKLLKSKGSFKSLKDYIKWVKISLYHFISLLLRTDSISSTASMVIYAKK